MKNRSRFAGIALALILGTFPVGAFAQQSGPAVPGESVGPGTQRPDEATTVEEFRDWSVRCQRMQPEEGADEVEVCEMIQEVSMEETGRTVMEVAVGYVPERELPILLFTVPLGVRLPPGLVLRVDDNEPVRVALELCGPNGCMATRPFDEALLNQFRAGLEGTVRIRDSRNQAHDLPVSLLGFTAALERLQQ